MLQVCDWIYLCLYWMFTFYFMLLRTLVHRTIHNDVDQRVFLCCAFHFIPFRVRDTTHSTNKTNTHITHSIAVSLSHSVCIYTNGLAQCFIVKYATLHSCSPSLCLTVTMEWMKSERSSNSRRRNQQIIITTHTYRLSFNSLFLNGILHIWYDLSLNSARKNRPHESTLAH